jgi:hypothetical protein
MKAWAPLGLAAILLAIPAAHGAPGQRTAPFAQPQTIQAIMDTIVDPSADGLWGSVGVVETRDGTQNRALKSPAEWSHVRVLAGRLAGGAAALRSPRPVGENGGGGLADATAPGARTASDIAREIAADPARFHAHADRLRQGAELAARAADAHDADGLLKAGAAIDAACEACHAAYWYPRAHLVLPSPEAFKGEVLGKP